MSGIELTRATVARRRVAARRGWSGASRERDKLRAVYGQRYSVEGVQLARREPGGSLSAAARHSSEATAAEGVCDGATRGGDGDADARRMRGRCWCWRREGEEGGREEGRDGGRGGSRMAVVVVMAVATSS